MNRSTLILAAFFILPAVAWPQDTGVISVGAVSAIPLPSTGGYFLGWSAAGKIAYLTIEALGGPAGAGERILLIVQDVVSDETVSQSYLDDVLGPGEELSGPDLITKVLKADAAAITSALKAAGIDSAKGARVEASPFTYKGKTYEIIVHPVNGTRSYRPFEEEPRDVKCLDSLTVEIRAGEKGKTFYNRKMKADEVVYNARFGCVVISPFEDRAVVFMALSRPDGDIGRRDELVASGAHLTIGFK